MTDPPYELGFMGKAWDGTGVAFDPETWRAVYRVLKPGAYLVAFGGTRTSHRMVCAIEDAGFEIRDSLTWLYGSGFPKSLNLGRGRGTALKPAAEPIVLARKPCSGTTTANVQRHGTGALNIDACRVGAAGGCKSDIPYIGGDSLHCYGKGLNDQRSRSVKGLGRWPANVLLNEEAAALLNTQSRFYYCAKPSRKERNAGCELLPARSGNTITGHRAGSAGAQCSPRAGVTESKRSNIHPTVKPVALMRWLVRLVTPINGTVLDPFAGSGSTGMACKAESRRCVLIEREAAYLPIIRARVRSVA